MSGRSTRSCEVLPAAADLGPEGQRSEDGSGRLLSTGISSQVATKDCVIFSVLLFFSPTLPLSFCRLLRQFDTALSFHSQELTLRKDTRDQQGECRALGHLAAVHMALGDYATTFQCYEAQLSLAQGLRDTRLEAQVHGNMGITKLNMGVFEEAIGYFEQQLAMLQQLSGTESLLDRGRAYGNLADCYDALGDYEEAIQYYEKYLTTAQSLNNIQDQEKAYRGLGNAHRYRAYKRNRHKPT